MSMQIEPPMHTAAQHDSHHHSADDARRDHAYLDAAKDRGWIPLDEIMKLASGSPVDADQAIHVSREGGIGLADDDANTQSDPWADLGTLAGEGTAAFLPSSRD